MGKIVATDKRVVIVTSEDTQRMKRTSLKLDREQADACATALAAARNAHVVCGPGIAAVAAFMAALPDELVTRWARHHLKCIL